LSTDQPAPRTPLLRLTLAGAASFLGLLLVATLGTVIALTGASLGCTGGDADATAGPQAGPAPTRTAREQIPADRLRLYRAAGALFRINWTFLASIGAQECDHGSCAGDNGYGCAGPMQIAIRKGSPCSPGSEPTEWDRFQFDGDRDGRLDVDDPADAIFTAARVLLDKGAPHTGGTYDQYRQAACRYYGACADAVASYADQVMARAVLYGFDRHGGPDAGVTAPDVPPAGGCVAGADADPSGGLGPVKRLRAPRHLAALPTAITGGTPMRCDARIVPDVIWLARRFHVQVTACQSIHSTAGEHPLGAATDMVPAPGRTWPESTGRLARAVGWKPSCAASGVAPACAKPPFRFVGYNGYPGHGDPAHCNPCGGGAHLHLSWLTSASSGQPENQPRTAYFAPSWIDVFSTSEATR